MIIANKTPRLNAQGMMAYLIDKHRDVEPRVLRGDRDLTCALYDLADQQGIVNKAVMSVISFRTNEKVTEEMKQKELDEFEKKWFDTLKEKVTYIAVEHNEKNNYHIHLYIVKMVDGRAFNPFPPGHQQALENYVAVRNYDNGFEQVEKTRLSRYQKPEFNKDSKTAFKKHSFKRNDEKKQIDEVLQNLVRNETLKNRDELINYLNLQGYEIARKNDNYISIKKDDESIRLKGGIYGTETPYNDLINRRPKAFDIDEKRLLVNDDTRKRNEYNQERFGAKPIKTMHKITKEITIATLSIPFEEKTIAKKIARENGCALFWKKEEQTWELKTTKDIPNDLQKYVTSSRKGIDEFEVEKYEKEQKEKGNKSSADNEKHHKNSSKNSQSSATGSNGAIRVNNEKMKEHKDSDGKASQNSFKQAVFKDDDKNNDSLSSGSSPGPSTRDTTSAQNAINKAIADMNSARTPEQAEKARMALIQAQANLERILAQIEEDRKRRLNKI